MYLTHKVLVSYDEQDQGMFIILTRSTVLIRCIVPSNVFDGAILRKHVYCIAIPSLCDDHLFSISI